MDASRRGRARLRGYVNSFTSGTTAHGFSRANAGQSWVRMVWVGIVLSASLGAIFHATKQVTTYLQYPVSSTNRLEPNSFEFPDLTFCDPLNKRFFHKSSSELARDARREDERVITYSLVYSHFGTETDWRKERKAIETIYTAWEHLLNITNVNIRPLDMVLYCTFEGEPCGHEDFRVYYHRLYTNCFTFKPRVRNLRSSGMDRGLFLLLYVPSADRSFPVDSLARLASGLENNGIRFQIHQKDTIPHPLEYGIMAPTGTLTAVGLEQVKTSLAKTPTHPCIPDMELELYDNQFNFTRRYLRQLFDCIKAEYSREVLERCGCMLESHVIIEPGFSSSSVNFCHDLIGAQNPARVAAVRRLFNLSVSSLPQPPRELGDYIKIGLNMRQMDPSLDAPLTRMMCADNVSENVIKPERCYDSCNYKKYSYSLSQCPWPEDSFEVRNAQIQMIKIAQMLDEYSRLHRDVQPLPALARSLLHHELNTNSCQTHDTQNVTVPKPEQCHRVQLFVRRSIVQLRVYPETLTVRHTIEERSYELVNLCSDMGGVLGLWIGFSIVTLFEFAELLIVCASYYWFRLISNFPRVKRNPMRIPKMLGAACSEHREVELFVNSSMCTSPSMLSAQSRGIPSSSSYQQHSDTQPLQTVA